MKFIRSFLLLILYLPFLFGCVSNKSIQPIDNKEAPTMVPNITYSIDNKNVSLNEFDEFLKSLNPIDKTWFCYDMSIIDENGKEHGGGLTGYDAEDESGNVYEYREDTNLEGIFYTISNKDNLKFTFPNQSGVSEPAL